VIKKLIDLAIDSRKALPTREGAAPQTMLAKNEN